MMLQTYNKNLLNKIKCILKTKVLHSIKHMRNYTTDVNSLIGCGIFCLNYQDLVCPITQKNIVLKILVKFNYI